MVVELKNEIYHTLLSWKEHFNDAHVLNCSIQHFLAFVGANFAGIAVNRFCIMEEDDVFHSLSSYSAEQLKQLAVAELSLGLNKPFHGTRMIERLWLAKILLENLCPNALSFNALHWRFRLLYIWSIILSERDIQLKRQMDELAVSLLELETQIPIDLFQEFLIERAHTHLSYFEHKAAKCCIEKATELAGIRKITLSGALGKRTQFQQRSAAQLMLELELDPISEEKMTKQPTTSLPHNCRNADDTLLEQVNFDNGHEHKQLNARQTACVMAMAFLEYQKSSNMRELKHQTTLVYVEEVISQSANWSFQTRALAERSHLEKENSRRVERASAQLESIYRLLDYDDNTDGNTADLSHRLELIFASAPLPFWTVGKMHAKVLISLGCVSDALRIFEQLGLWDEVVECYVAIRQPEKAESLVRKMLEEKEEPNLYCLLGDITNNANYYEIAIQITNGHCTRAHAALGKMKLAAKEYSAAIEHFQRSLELQPLKLDNWFGLGYSAMKNQDYKIAANAYHQCVNIDPEQFESWNNLASCYIRLGQKQRAQKFLQEALKLSWDNVYVLDNLLQVSLEIGDFKQVIAVMEKNLDADRKKPLDELPLRIIAKEILNGAEPVKELKPSVLAILARATSRQSLSSELVYLHARLKRPDVGNTDCTAWSNYVQLLDKAFQRQYDQIVFSQENTDAENATNLAKQLSELIREWQHLWQLKQLQPAQVKLQLQMRTKPMLHFLEKQFGQNCENADDEELKRVYAEIGDLLKI